MVPPVHAAVHGRSRKTRGASRVPTLASDSLLPLAVIVVALIAAIALVSNLAEQRARTLERERTLALQGQAGGVASDYVVAQFDGGSSVTTGQSASSSIAANRIDEFGEWADGIPADMAKVKVSDVIHDGDTARVKARINTLTPDPVLTRRVLATDVWIRLHRVDDAWAIADATTSRGGLGVLDDPIVERDGNVTVIADSEFRGLAERAVGVGSSSLDELQETYGPIGDSSDEVLIVVAADVADAEQVFFGEDGYLPPGVGGITTQTGSIVLDGNALSQLEPEYAESIIVHELAHRATYQAFDKMPKLLAEGIAMHAEGEFGMVFDMRRVPGAFESGRLDYQGLLHGDYRRMAAPTDEDIQSFYLMGYATVAYIDAQFGREKLHAFLGALDGTGTIDAAARSTLGITTTQLEAGVHDWVARHIETQTAKGIEFQ